MISLQPSNVTSSASALPSLSSRGIASAPGAKVALQEQKLRKAAAEFESILLSTFWKSMKETFSDSEEDSSDPAHGTLEDFAVQAMSTAVGKAGGLGLGRLILKQLEPQLRQQSQNSETKSK